jgi:hypothetical protein
MNLEIIKDSIQKKLLGKSEKMVGSPEPEIKPNFLKILNEFAKSMVSLPGLAKDLNIAKRNLGALIKLKGGKPANKADMFFLKADEREAKFEVDMANQISKDEASKTPTTEKAEEPQDPLQKIMTSLLGVFGLGALGKYFSISKILKSLKIIGITFLITTIASGIYQAYKEFTKTGDILASVKAGFVEFIDFVTMGIFGKENIGKLFDDVINFLVPIAETVGNFIDGIGKFFSKKFEQFKRFFGLKEEKQSEPKTEEARKSYIETLNEDINFLKEKRDSLNTIVETKSEKLKTLQEEERRKSIEEAKASAQKVKDAVKNVGSKILNVVSPPAKTEAPAPSTAESPSAAPSAAPAPIAGGATEKPGEKGGGSLAQLVKPQSGVDINSFKSPLEDAVAKMAAAFKNETGKQLIITSGFRSNEKQKELYDLELKKTGGDAAAARKMVAEPSPPLGKGKGSLHSVGLAIDIKPTEGSKGTGSPKGFLNELAGTRTASTGFLEKFGLSRPVENEDWHVQLANQPPVGDGKNVVNDNGKVTNLETGKPVVGEKVSKNSVELAQNQREQEKRQTPTVINAGTTNNNTHVVNKHRVEEPA